MNHVDVVERHLACFELDGTRGGYRMTHPEEPVRVCSEALDGGASAWQEPQSLPAPGIPPIDQWLAAIETGADVEFGIDEAVQLTELMAAARTLGSSRRRGLGATLLTPSWASQAVE